MLTAADVMTPEVFVAAPTTPVAEIAKLLHEKRISGVPVVDGAGAVVGMVSEGDLIGRTEVVGMPRQSWWLRAFGDPDILARDYAKSHGRFARDVMSAPVTTVAASATLAEIAKLLEQHRIKRVPVVKDGKLVGIVTRSNLLQALGAANMGKPASADDRSIRERLLAELESQPWASMAAKNVVVQDGVVHLWGFVRTDDERRALVVAAQNIPGAKAVEDHLREYRMPVGASWS